ncbi:MAG: TRAP transporter small permease subunit [Bacteriovorax sp.]|jgi:TRAP-type C4-dicarboxylate transport system permease small subunit|nr:TRAP transporter small permease subunit [Bacteriovorax sp.]
MVAIKKLDWAIEKFSSWILVLSILAILSCSSLSIVLRWFQINLSWIDPFVRHLVLLGTFVGGVVATGRGNHIGIDLISKYLEVKKFDHAKFIVNRIILFSSGLVLIWMIKSGIDFTKVEMEFSKSEFWGLQSGYLVAMIPFGLGLIAIRFFTLFILTFEKKVGDV